MAGLELKRELVVGELRNPRQAMLPIAGAIGGMVVPALVCLAVAWGAPGGRDAWPVPVATDIAFALAVLAITARDLPPSLRVFLLSLAIVDDLGAILLIAVLFTSHISVLALLGAVGRDRASTSLLQQLRVKGWWIYLPLGLLAWVLMHESGIHATIAGVAIGLATRVKPDPGEHESPAELLEHRLQPISAGICVPLFAFFAAGIPFSPSAHRRDRSPTAPPSASCSGWSSARPSACFGGAVVAVKSRLATLPEALHWHDLAAVAVLTGCGFTVSLLIAELAFPEGTQQNSIKAAVLVGSLTASLLAAALLRRRARATQPVAVYRGPARRLHAGANLLHMSHFMAAGSPDDSVVMTPGPWEHRFVSANGSRFHVAELGSGPLVLLLHGFPEFWWAWHQQLPLLADAGYRAVAVDLRGYGASDKPPRGYDGFTLAADVTGLIRALGERRAAVVGRRSGRADRLGRGRHAPQSWSGGSSCSARHTRCGCAPRWSATRGSAAPAPPCCASSSRATSTCSPATTPPWSASCCAEWTGPGFRATADYAEYERRCREAMQHPPGGVLRDGGLPLGFQIHRCGFTGTGSRGHAPADRHPDPAAAGRARHDHAARDRAGLGQVCAGRLRVAAARRRRALPAHGGPRPGRRRDHPLGEGLDASAYALLAVLVTLRFWGAQPW